MEVVPTTHMPHPGFHTFFGSPAHAFVLPHHLCFPTVHHLWLVPTTPHTATTPYRFLPHCIPCTHIYTLTNSFLLWFPIPHLPCSLDSSTILDNMLPTQVLPCMCSVHCSLHTCYLLYTFPTQFTWFIVVSHCYCSYLCLLTPPHTHYHFLHTCSHFLFYPILCFWTLQHTPPHTRFVHIYHTCHITHTWLLFAAYTHGTIHSAPDYFLSTVWLSPAAHLPHYTCTHCHSLCVLTSLCYTHTLVTYFFCITVVSHHFFSLHTHIWLVTVFSILFYSWFGP